MKNSSAKVYFEYISFKLARYLTCVIKQICVFLLIIRNDNIGKQSQLVMSGIKGSESENGQVRIILEGTKAIKKDN